MNHFSLLLLNFQDPATPVMEGIIDLHNYIFFYLVLIIIFIGVLMVMILSNFYLDLVRPQTVELVEQRYHNFGANAFSHHTNLEVVWTFVPGLVLIFMILPSFALLYSMDEVILPGLVIKVMGQQWGWTYEYSALKGYPDGAEPDLDSFIIYEEDLKHGGHRLLEVDHPIVVPANAHIRFIITSFDILHSWAIPALGVKMDAVPGRLSQVSVFVKREGTFYGQCSEICGIGHGFMPVVLQAVSFLDFMKYYHEIFYIQCLDDEVAEEMAEAFILRHSSSNDYYPKNVY